MALTGWSGCRSSPDPARLFAEAESLRLRYEKAASQQAIDKYRAAMAGWKLKGDSRNAARASQGIGATYEQLGSLQASLQAYLEALPFARKSADRLLESEVLSDVGAAESLAADSDEAFDRARGHCQLALDIARRPGGAREEARALTCLGEAAYNNGDRNTALPFYHDAEILWIRLGDRRGQAESLLYQGWAYSDMSDFSRARAFFDAAWSTWSALGDTRGKALTLIAEARLRVRCGDYDEALIRATEALRLLEPMGDAVWEGAGLTLVATVYLYLGETDAALRHWERALQIFDTAGLRMVSVDVLMSLGETYLASGDAARALDRCERALALANELGNQPSRANALRDIGAVFLARRRPAEAVRALGDSLSAQRTLGDPRLDARTRADLGDAYDLLNDHDSAARYFSEALVSSRKAEDRVAEARALFGLGRASFGLNKLDAAREHLARALNVVESLRTTVESRDLRASYVASIYQYHELYVDVLTRLDQLRPGKGLAAAAFEANERARARSLLESLTESGVDLRGGIDPALLEREKAVNKEFDLWGERQRRLAGAPPAEADALAPGLRAQYRDLEERYTQIQAEIRRRSPRYAALTQPQPLSLRDVQKHVLDADTLLLEYALGEKRSRLWAVSNRAHESFELPPRAEIEVAARRVYQLLTAGLEPAGSLQDRQRRIERANAEYWQEAAHLSEMLLAPVAKEIAGKRLLVVADGALQFVPFAALPVPGRPDGPVPLVVAHEIVNLPSASVLAVLRRETANRISAPKAVVVLADPVFESDDPRLPKAVAAPDKSRRSRPQSGTSAQAAAGTDGTIGGSDSPRGNRAGIPRLTSTRQEARDIVALAPEGMAVRKLDFDASRAFAMSPGLAQYRIVHFATHGVFDSENPGLSRIALSMFDAGGRPQDGFLRPHDIYNLTLPVELVVLSACNTALGKDVRGEGLVGVVRGFMYAGARRIIASLWKVDDEATGELMRRFYRQILQRGQSPATALREVQVAMWQDERWQAPFYWAAFVLQGEWR